MYKLLVTGHFDAAHHLRDYKGKCARPHGHRFTAQVEISGTDLDSTGMLIDFVAVKRSLLSILDELDHNDLNSVLDFNPTAENLAKWIYSNIKVVIPQVTSVTIWESPDCGVTYGNE